MKVLSVMRHRLSLLLQQLAFLLRQKFTPLRASALSQ
jgi:hypothetical protein